MKLIKLIATNFGSYDTLEFNFKEQGLALIQGPTGSGKSTLLDAPTWALFGITAKDGAADDIRGWNNLASPTKVILQLEVADLILNVTRIRGKANENDLFWTEGDGSGPERRGKDIRETQQLINQKLGVDSSTYLAGSYFCEYSPSATFFLSNAKQRRQLFDKVAFLEFPTELGLKLSEKVTLIKRDVIKLTNESESIRRQILVVHGNFQDSKNRESSWEYTHSVRLEELQKQHEAFLQKTADECLKVQAQANLFEDNKLLSLAELQKEQDNTVPYCAHCGQGTDTTKLQAKITRLKNETNPWSFRLKELENKTSPYDEVIKKAEKEVNPFAAQAKHFLSQLNSKQVELGGTELELAEAKKRQANLETLRDLALVLKAKLLEQSVSSIENRTNEALEKHFDGELRVAFQIADNDSLEVSLFKNGHEAVYKQLSKGQRQLLKLTFSVAVMESVSNRSGIKFNTLFFDESLDGMDDQLKTKAFSLFSTLELEHESVLVIDHAESFKNLFNKQYLVSIESDRSAIVDAEHENFST